MSGSKARWARAQGHLWTIGSSFRGISWNSPPWNWAGSARDPILGEVPLTGRWSAARDVPRVDGADTDSAGRPTVVIVHGLAGSAHSGYVRRLARAVNDRGWNALSLNLRGADGRGEDLYHAGLGSDLAFVVESLPGDGPVHLVGYSLGGHLVLRYLAGACPEGGRRDGVPVAAHPRVRGAIAVCAPLDLLRCVRVIDGADAVLYRRSLLRRLNRLYAEVAARRGERERAEQARRVQTIQEWDELIVAPRFGFHGAEDYYRTVSAGPSLARLDRRALVVIARHDPMVPSETLEPFLSTSPLLESAWVERGGHVAIPRRALGLGSGTTEAQLVGWLAAAD